jgi:hypothetical protein
MGDEKNTYEMYELQFDDKPNGVTIRLNDSVRCVLRICGVPREMVYDGDRVREWVDITYPPVKKPGRFNNVLEAAMAAMKTLKNDGYSISADGRTPQRFMNYLEVVKDGKTCYIHVEFLSNYGVCIEPDEHYQNVIDTVRNSMINGMGIKAKDEAVCPVCKDTNTDHVERRENNGVIGIGHSSWVVDEYWFCKDCGVRFQKVTIKKYEQQ